MKETEFRIMEYPNRDEMGRSVVSTDESNTVQIVVRQVTVEQGKEELGRELRLTCVLSGIMIDRGKPDKMLVLTGFAISVEGKFRNFQAVLFEAIVNGGFGLLTVEQAEEG